ncbi:hypothetical protein [Microbaculum sp. FT89]|uniref:hypothetical protein n=1 Tax=Microbaculum sp. FT89 TaxID=3447298 RepID=UPI003F53707F
MATLPASTVPANARSLDWEIIANSNTVIPGTSKTYSSFNQPSINNNCLTTFRARGTGPSTPPSGVYYVRACKSGSRIRKLFARGDLVPAPNNTGATFKEFPSFSRIDVENDFIASRGQSDPVWTYTTPSGDTKVGTAGIYFGTGKTFIPGTGASLLGAVPGFWYFDVPDFPGTKFDQFPGAPAPFDGKFIAFKGNYTETIGAATIARTGVYLRQIGKRTELPVVKIADTHDRIPGTSTTFGSTAPPSAAAGMIVFLGLDNEDNPTLGGIYRAKAKRPKKLRDRPRRLRTLVAIGDKVPGFRKQRFTRFGEGLSFDGNLLTFWGAWGDQMRTVRLHCPVDGNADLIAECIVQCPDTDAVGNYCERQVPANQGIFVRYPDGKIKRVASTRRTNGNFQDFLFWVFSGRPPGVGGGGDDGGEVPEPPRWRSSAFAAVSSNRSDVPSVVFKAIHRTKGEGLYLRRRMTKKRIVPIIRIGDDAAPIDSAAPAGSRVTSVGVERDGYRNCHLVVNAGFLNEATSESWAGVYLEKNACTR